MLSPNSSLLSFLVERLTRPKDLVGKHNVVSLLQKRLFFLRKIRSGQNIPNIYPHPLFFKLQMNILPLQHLFNRMMHCVTFPKMQPHNTITMKPQVIKKLRENFFKLSQSGKEFGLLITCANGYFIKMYLSPVVETEGFMMDLEMFHESKGKIFFYHAVPVNLLSKEVHINIFLQMLDNYNFKLFYTDKFRIPLFNSEIVEYKNFEIKFVTFYEKLIELPVHFVQLVQSSRKRKCSQNASSGMNKRFCCFESLFEEMNAMLNHNPVCISKRMKGMCLAPDA